MQKLKNLNEENNDNRKELEKEENINNFDEKKLEISENRKELGQYDEINRNSLNLKPHDDALGQEKNYDNELKNSSMQEVLENNEVLDEDINENSQKIDEINIDKGPENEGFGDANQDPKNNDESAIDINFLNKNEINEKNEQQIQEEDSNNLKQTQMNDDKNDFQNQEQIANEILVDENLENQNENKNFEEKESNAKAKSNNEIDLYENSNKHQDQKEMLESGNQIEMKKSKESINEYQEIINEKNPNNDFLVDVSPKFQDNIPENERKEGFPEKEKKNENNAEILSKSKGEFQFEQGVNSKNLIENSLNFGAKTNFVENMIEDVKNNSKNEFKEDDVQKNNFDGSEIKAQCENYTEKNNNNNEEYTNEKNNILCENNKEFQNDIEEKNREKNEENMLEINQKVKKLVFVKK